MSTYRQRRRARDRRDMLAVVIGFALFVAPLIGMLSVWAIHYLRNWSG